VPTLIRIVALPIGLAQVRRKTYSGAATDSTLCHRYTFSSFSAFLYPQQCAVFVGSTSALVVQGFMGRLMIRLLGFPIAAQVFWRNGMLARIARYAPYRFASLLISPMARG